MFETEHDFYQPGRQCAVDLQKPFTGRNINEKTGMWMSSILETVPRVTEGETGSL